METVGRCALVTAATFAAELRVVERGRARAEGRQPLVSARTVVLHRVSKRTAEAARARLALAEPRQLPATRAECVQGEHAERPCPFVSCRWHLYLDVSDRTGSLKLNFPGLEPWELAETCALDVADRGGVTLEDVGQLMNLTRERIRQFEVRGVARLKALSEMAALRDYCE